MSTINTPYNTDAGCDEDMVVATASVGFLVMATQQSRFRSGGIEIINNAFNGLHCDIMLTAVKIIYHILCQKEVHSKAICSDLHYSAIGNSTNCRQTEFNVWYIDDRTVECIMSDILHDIRIIKSEVEMI